MPTIKLLVLIVGATNSICFGVWALRQPNTRISISIPKFPVFKSHLALISFWHFQQLFTTVLEVQRFGWCMFINIFSNELVSDLIFDLWMLSGFTLYQGNSAFWQLAYHSTLGSFERRWTKGHDNVRSCLLTIYQYHPIGLQCSWLNVEQSITFWVLLCMYRTITIVFIVCLL